MLKRVHIHVPSFLTPSPAFMCTHTLSPHPPSLPLPALSLTIVRRLKHSGSTFMGDQGLKTAEILLAKSCHEQVSFESGFKKQKGR